MFCISTGIIILLKVVSCGWISLMLSWCFSVPLNSGCFRHSVWNFGAPKFFPVWKHDVEYLIGISGWEGVLSTLEFLLGEVTLATNYSLITPMMDLSSSSEPRLASGGQTQEKHTRSIRVIKLFRIVRTLRVVKTVTWVAWVGKANSLLSLP